MPSKSKGARVTRISKNIISPNHILDNTKGTGIKLIHASKRHRSLASNSKVTPFNDPTRIRQQFNNPSLANASSVYLTDSSYNLLNTSKEPFYAGQSTASIKDMNLSWPSHQSSVNLSTSSAGLINVLAARYEEAEKTKRNRRRRAGFYMSQRCCFIMIAAAFIAILLAGIIAAIVIFTTHGKVTTTGTTSTTTSSTTTTTTTTSTTSSTTTSTTSSTTSSTSTTTTTTTTTPCSSCAGNYTWNQTGIIVADTSSNTIPDPRCINFQGNNTLYFCSHQNNDVQKWVVNSPSRTVVTDGQVDHTDYISFGNNGVMYTNNHDTNTIRRYPPGSSVGTIIAGSGSTVSGNLSSPRGTVVDENYTLYIADSGNDRVVKLEQNGTSLITVINASNYFSKMSALLLNPFSSNQIYISDEDGANVYLWTFGASTPNVNYTDVNCGDKLDNPRGIKMDRLGNLYVADQDNNRIVMYCANSTMGTIILNLSDKPKDIALDPELNLYVLLDNGQVYKHQLI